MLAANHNSIDVSAGGLVIGLLLGALVYFAFEWVGAPRVVSGLAAALVVVLFAFDF